MEDSAVPIQALNTYGRPGPSLRSVRTLRSLRSARDEINRRPVGVDGIRFEAYWSLRDYVLWNQNVLHVFDTPNPLNYLQLRMLYGEPPDPTEQVYAKDRFVERGTIADAIINRALARKLNKNFDLYFSESSWGYRPGRSPELAIQKARRAIRNGAHWGLKTDVKKFFSNVNRAILRQQLAATVRDQGLVNLIMSQISPVVITQGGDHVAERKGLPEGNGLTPFLSNLHLHGFDHACRQSFPFYGRYADDILVLGNNQNEVVEARRFIESALNCLGLQLNQSKTFIRDLLCQPITFLGYELRGGNIYPPPKAITQLARNLRIRGQEDRKAVMSAFVRRYRIGPVRKLFRRIDRVLHQLYPPGVTLVGLLDKAGAESVADIRPTQTVHLGTSLRRGRSRAD